MQQVLAFLSTASVLRVSVNLAMGEHTFDDVCQQCKETRCEEDSEDVT